MMKSQAAPIPKNSPEATTASSARGLLLFFTLTLGSMGLCGGLAGGAGGERGLYPVILITVIEVVVALLIVRPRGRNLYSQRRPS